MPIRALDVLDVLDCPHRVYLNHNGDLALRSPITHFMELLHENGVKHETEVIQDFEYEPVLGEDFRALFDTTLGLMRRGARLIYQGALIRDDMRGRPDLLARRDGRSSLGEYFYFPIEIKNASAYEDRERQRRKKNTGYSWRTTRGCWRGPRGSCRPKGRRST